MAVNRRELLVSGLVTTACSTMFPGKIHAQPIFAPKPKGWRTFEVITQIEVPTEGAPAQAWIPVPLMNESEWFQTLQNVATSNGRHALWNDPRYGAGVMHVHWSGSEPKGTITVTSRIMTRDRAVDWSKPVKAQLSESHRQLYTSPTEHIPLDGLVKQVSDEITESRKPRTDVEKVRAVYEWIIARTYRDANVRGCGTGDIVALLKSGKLGGKCADLNALFVGLVRAQGIPARDIYGIRVAPSVFGYKSLGANSATITKAQHCRAEVHLVGLGWVPMDPADVRKVVLEESPGNLSADDPRVVAARQTLFGAWEANWMAYNSADGIPLPGAKGGKPSFFMYPEAETVAGRLDCLDPDTFRYTITSSEVVT